MILPENTLSALFKQIKIKKRLMTVRMKMSVQEHLRKCKFISVFITSVTVWQPPENIHESNYLSKA